MLAKVRLPKLNENVNQNLLAHRTRRFVGRTRVAHLKRVGRRDLRAQAAVECQLAVAEYDTQELNGHGQLLEDGLTNSLVTVHNVLDQNFKKLVAGIQIVGRLDLLALILKKRPKLSQKHVTCHRYWSVELLHKRREY